MNVLRQVGIENGVMILLDYENQKRLSALMKLNPGTAIEVARKFWFCFDVL